MVCPSCIKTFCMSTATLIHPLLSILFLHSSQCSAIFYLLLFCNSPLSFLLTILLDHGFYSHQEQVHPPCSTGDDERCKIEGRDQDKTNSEVGHKGPNHLQASSADCRSREPGWRTILEGTSGMHQFTPTYVQVANNTQFTKGDSPPPDMDGTWSNKCDATEENSEDDHFTFTPK